MKVKQTGELATSGGAMVCQPLPGQGPRPGQEKTQSSKCYVSLSTLASIPHRRPQ